MVYLVPVQTAVAIVMLKLSEAGAEPFDVRFDEASVRGEDPPAQESEAIGNGIDAAFAGMDLEAVGDEKFLNGLPHAGKFGVRAAEKDEIIDVPGILARFQLAADEMIQGIEIDIGEELRGLIAERQAATALKGSKQMVAGKIPINWFLRVGGGDDGGGESESAAALDDAGQLLVQDVVIHGSEIFPDVAFQDVGMIPGGGPRPFDGEVGAEALAASEGIREEATFPDGFEDSGEGVVNDAVAEGSSGDLPRFGIENLECSVSTRTIGIVFQLPAKCQQIGFEGKEERRHIGPGALSGSGGVGGGEQVLKAGQAGPEAGYSFHRRPPICLRHPPAMRPTSSHWAAAKA